MKTVLLFIIRVYQLTVSPWLRGCCRFTPSCSAYAWESIAVHGALRGSFMTFKRLLRCQPFHPGGFDPVLPAPHRRKSWRISAS